MEKKHGELKLMAVEEMVDMFVNSVRNENAVGMDFATLEFSVSDLNGIPSKYFDLERVYEDAWGWNGIRVLNNPFDTTDVIVAVGHYGSTLCSVFQVDLEYGYEDDMDEVADKLRSAICCSDNGEIDSDSLLIVEMHDAMYILAEEEKKRQKKMCA